MNRFKIRVYDVGALGFFTQADGYRDYEIDTDESHEKVVKRLLTEGLQDGKKWYLPGAIVWVEKMR